MSDFWRIGAVKKRTVCRILGLNENVLKINGSNVSSFYRMDTKKMQTDEKRFFYNKLEWRYILRC